MCNNPCKGGYRKPRRKTYVVENAIKDKQYAHTPLKELSYNNDTFDENNAENFDNKENINHVNVVNDN